MNSRSGVRRGADKPAQPFPPHERDQSRQHKGGNGSSLPNERGSRQRQSIMARYEFLRVSIVTTIPAFVDGGGL